MFTSISVEINKQTTIKQQNKAKTQSQTKHCKQQDRLKYSQIIKTFTITNLEQEKSQKFQN